MTNFYWPVYLNLETELNALMVNIHIDDKQLHVYSSKISDLILRASIEIESISKDLYTREIKPHPVGFKFDEGLKKLNSIYFLEEKEVVISSVNCFQSKRIIKPFIKDEPRTFREGLTYSWNNSYQNIKHDRAKSREFGSIKYLFDAMAALYLLNVLYKEEIQFVGSEPEIEMNFKANQGSSIFSVNYTIARFSDPMDRLEVIDKESTYKIVPTEVTYLSAQQEFLAFRKILGELAIGATMQKLEKEGIDKDTIPQEELIRRINQESVDNKVIMNVAAQQNAHKMNQAIFNMRYEAIIIKQKVVKL